MVEAIASDSRLMEQIWRYIFILAATRVPTKCRSPLERSGALLHDATTE